MQTQMDTHPIDAGSVEEFYLATVRRTFDLVRRAAAGDRHLAEDATQDAYLVMIARWNERQHNSLDKNAHYVVGIAMNKLVDSYRRRNRLAELDDQDSGAEDPAIDRLLGDLSLLEAVRHLLATQPARRRIVGVLYFLDDWEFGEIAEVLGMASSTVRTHVDRLRRLLRTHIVQPVELRKGVGPS